MKATIKDVARECGVSIATVSLALSEKPSRVSQVTKRRIQDAAEKLNYIPSRAAVSLATNKTRMIGFLADDFRNTYIASNYMIIQQKLQEKGYYLLTSTLSGSQEDILNSIRNLLSCGIEALIYTQSEHMDEGLDDRIYQILESSGVPIVSCDNTALENLGPSFNCNYRKGGYLATKYLLEQGYREIACVTGTETLRVTQDRIEGYKDALREYAVPYDPELLFYGDYTMKSGEDALPYLLGKGVKVVFAFNDQMAFGLYRAARQYHISIPEDLSIIGFDNVLYDEVLEKPLSSVGFDYEKIADEIAKKLVLLVETGGTIHLNKTEKNIFEPMLFIRASIRSKNRQL